MQYRLNEIIFLLSLNFAVGNFGPLEPSLNRLVSLSLFIWFALAFVPRDFWTVNYLKTITVLLISLLLYITLIQGGVWIASLGLVFLLIGLIFFLKSLRLVKARLTVLLLTSIVYIFYLLQYLLNDYFFMSIYNFSLSYSKFITEIVGHKSTLGPTTLGLPSTIVVLIYCTVIFFISKKKKLYILITSIFLILSINIFYISMYIPLLSFLNLLNISDTQIMFYFTILQFICQAIAVSWATKKVEYRNLPLTINSADSRSAFVSIGIVFVLVLVLSFSFQWKDKPRKVMFYEKGYLNWLVPTYNNYGRYSHGMFGLLPKYLERDGYEIIKQSGVMTNQVLQDVGILVIINLTYSFPEEEKQAIYKFVEDGGSLLVLGDHTNVEGIMGPSNNLLKPFGIRLNFDTAEALVAGWAHCLLRPYPMVRGLESGLETGIGVGSSLSVGLSASPVVIARYGWSDKGNPNNFDQGYLGNRTFDCDEQLGDLILVAQQDYGKGKVLVFGDTSTFQNDFLVLSYNFVLKVFDCLSSKTMVNFNAHRIVIVMLLLIMFGYFARRIDIGVTFLVLCVFSIAIALLVSDLVLVKESSLRSPTSKVAYIDASHMERYSRILGTDQSLSGLASNLVRAEYRPVFLKKFSREVIFKGRILVMNAPAKSFSAGEQEVLKTFMDQGGLLIWVVGWEERFASESFLNELGLVLADVPLGPTSQTLPSENAWFQEAWLIKIQKPAKVLKILLK